MIWTVKGQDIVFAACQARSGKPPALFVEDVPTTTTTDSCTLTHFVGSWVARGWEVHVDFEHKASEFVVMCHAEVRGEAFDLRLSCQTDSGCPRAFGMIAKLLSSGASRRAHFRQGGGRAEISYDLPAICLGPFFFFSLY